jgi:hypothetical protein
MITAGLVAVVALMIGGTIYFLGLVSAVLRGLIKDLRDEREMVTLQKKIVTLSIEQVALQRSMIDKRYEMVANSIATMKLLAERHADPVWMNKFEEGRDNARFN